MSSREEGEALYGRMAGRPEHEDFWRLSTLVVERDRRVDSVPASAKEAVFVDEISRFIDIDVLRGFAEDRALRLLGVKLGGRVTPRVDELARYASVYVDAFVQGAEYNSLHGPHGGPAGTGERDKARPMNDERIGHHVDPASLRYLAQQRSYRLLGLVTVADAQRRQRDVERLSLLYVGAFVEGAEYNEAYGPPGERHEVPPEGA
jgi:hypothetical protein